MLREFSIRSYRSRAAHSRGASEDPQGGKCTDMPQSYSSLRHEWNWFSIFQGITRECVANLAIFKKLIRYTDFPYFDLLETVYRVAYEKHMTFFWICILVFCI